MSKISKGQIEIQLLNAIPENGNEIPSSEARLKLSPQLKRPVTQDEFSKAQEILLEGKKVLRGRRGMRAVLSKPAAADPSKASAPQTLEREMEADIERFLHLHFVPDIIDPIPRTVEFLIQNTARGGPVAGLWTRPDHLSHCLPIQISAVARSRAIRFRNQKA